MKHTQSIRNFALALAVAAGFLLSFNTARADTVKLKDGKTIDGVITFEASDMLKIRVQRPGSTITETKTILKSDVAEVIKSAPDDVDFAKLKGLLPSPSLMTTSQYRTMIDKGPQAFLNSYPDSKHSDEVEKIKGELENELEKVNQGFIKISGEWISPKSQRDYRELIDARKLNLAIQQSAQGADFIGALRAFEKMEENYYGTPSYIEAVKTAQQILPALGKRLQRMVADVEFVNKQFEEDLAKMPEEKRGPVMAARKQEEDRLKQRFDADKASGIKWYQPNTRDKDDLSAYISMVAAEIESLNTLDLAALEAQAKELVKVDELIAEDKIEDAKTLLKETTGVSAGRGKGSSSSRKSTSPYGDMKGAGSRSGRGRSAPKTTYTMALKEKINMKEDAIALAKTQAENSAEGQAAVDAIRQGREAAATAPILDTETVEGNSGSEAEDATDALTGLIDSTVVPEKKKPKATEKSKPATKTPVKKEKEDAPKRPVSSGGFQFKFQYVIYGIAGLMVIAVVLMKVLGIGGAKEG